MKTDQVYHIVIHNPTHCEAVQRRLFELGYDWSIGKKRVDHLDAASLQAGIDPMGITYATRPKWGASWTNKPHRVITLDDLYGPEFCKPQTVDVKLNDSHKAVVSRDSIKVGCQTFPISVLDELVKARDSLK